jgi:cytochrome c oxidase subunit 2
MRRVTSLFSAALGRLFGTALGVAALAVVAEAQGKRWGPTEAASDYGYRFTDLFWLITILCSVSFVIVCILLAIPTLRDRARPGKRAHFDHGASLKDKRVTAVVSATVFIVLDAWVLVIAMGDLREAWWNIPDAAAEDTYRVEVLGQQWAWNFRHAGEDGEFGTADDIIQINELTVPVDRAVSFQLTSKDVIHSLFFPDMRVKKDTNPGAINETWFRAITAGEYTILCAELCGFAHYQMHGKLHVLEQDQFESWHEDASRLGVAAFDPEDEEAQWAWDWQEQQ